MTLLLSDPFLKSGSVHNLLDPKQARQSHRRDEHINRNHFAGFCLKMYQEFVPGLAAGLNATGFYNAVSATPNEQLHAASRSRSRFGRSANATLLITSTCTLAQTHHYTEREPERERGREGER